jgi:7-keto-8-aminopelargonate synthetase-like enzyme
LGPFEPLRAQIDAARQAEIYPFFAAVDELLASADRNAPLVVLVANDYLGLSSDLWVREAARRAVTEFGTSRCASPLAGGYTTLSETLETSLSAFLERKRRLFRIRLPGERRVDLALVGRND